MSDTKTEQNTQPAVQTTGHAWDGDLQEFNNPLPRWWLWSFYATVVFAVVYWIVYPSWPVGGTWLKGVASATVTVDDQQKTVDWNTRSMLLEDLQSGPEAVRQRKYLEQVAAADFAQIQKDPQMLAFARSAGKQLFSDNCAACHGAGGQGVIGLFPNLADDDWLWGGTYQDIQYTLTHGRKGYMPAFKTVLSAQQLDEVARYVLMLSGEVQPSDASERGKAIFQGNVGGCFMCHGTDGKGIKSMGSANLSDKVWTIVDEPGAGDEQAKLGVVKTAIANGVWDSRNMPAWLGRLSDADIKLLTVYVHQLGGGQ